MIRFASLINIYFFYGYFELIFNKKSTPQRFNLFYFINILYLNDDLYSMGHLISGKGKGKKKKILLSHSIDLPSFHLSFFHLHFWPLNSIEFNSYK